MFLLCNTQIDTKKNRYKGAHVLARFFALLSRRAGHVAVNKKIFGPRVVLLSHTRIVRARKTRDKTL